MARIIVYWGGGNEDLPISYEGFLIDDARYSISSGGQLLGNVASCLIDGKEYASNVRGLNFVVYDNQKHEVVDTACFDTFVSSVRDASLEYALSYILENKVDYTSLSDRLKKLYLYNCRCVDRKAGAYARNNLTKDGLLDYLDTFWNHENQMIFISVKDEAAASLDKEARKAFKEKGLSKLAKLAYRDSYLAVIRDGEVLYESRDHGSGPLVSAGSGYELVSGGYESGNCSSIKINGKEHSKNSRGINVVIYDVPTGEVVDKAAFDTCAVPVRTTALP